jgi:hypothetical protein
VRIAFVSIVVVAVSTVLSGCSLGTQGKAGVPPPVPTITVPADKPPSPKGWPAYPTFSAHSCWTAPPSGTGVLRGAPSMRPRGGERATPAEISRRLLARLGDRRYIRNIVVGAPPRIVLEHARGYYGARPPADAVWAYIDAPAATASFGDKPTPEQTGALMVAEWEVALVRGALRDDLCAAGGPPFGGSSVDDHTEGAPSNVFALEQRFPNPSEAAFRRRVDLVGRRYGFRVVSLRLLRPRQIAPLLVVETSRDRRAFVGDISAIMSLVNPISAAAGQNAFTFEGFLLEARDGSGSFVRVDNVNRGEASGGQWSWDRCVYPYEHTQPIAAKPCP